MQPAKLKAVLAASALALAICLALAAPGLAAKAMVLKPCLNCHGEFKKMDNVVAGIVQSRSMRAKTLSVKIGKKNVVLKFSKSTTLKNAPAIRKLRNPMRVLVAYQMDGSHMVALSIKVKPVFKVVKNKLLNVAQMAALVKKGGFLLIDSRPPAHFRAGHLPGAINVPLPKMNKALKTIFPKDKGALIVFYCQGFR